MRRRLLNILAVMSLLLGLMMAGLWVRSYSTRDVLWVLPEQRGTAKGAGLLVDSGEVFLSHQGLDQLKSMAKYRFEYSNSPKAEGSLSRAVTELIRLDYDGWYRGGFGYVMHRPDNVLTWVVFPI
ncbi:MAG TPA: hypothetical protein VGB55_11605, partial [Tepidisphaeraceae bacterium]